MKYPRKVNAKDSGMALLLALFLTVFVGLMMVPVLQRAQFHHNNAFRENRFLTAFHIAEAGIEEALWQLSFDDDETWEGWNTSDSETYTLPATELKDTDGAVVGEYRVQIDDPLGLGTYISIGAAGAELPFAISSETEPTITATAGVPDLTTLGSEVRVIQVRAEGKTAMSLGLFSDGDLEIGGTALVNSYDSRDGLYDATNNSGDNVTAGSNGDILLFGNPLIDGNAAAGGAVVLTGNNSEVTGEVLGGMTHIDLPPVTNLVDAAKLANDNADIPMAIKSNGQLVQAYNPATSALDVASGATLTLPGGTKENPKVYYLSGAQLNGNSSLIVEDYVVVFTDGDLDFNGGTVINNGGAGPPEKFQIYSSGGPDTLIKINGGGGYAGTVYAPTGGVQINGNGDMWGALVGGKIDVTGNGEFHYDEALGNVGPILYFAVEEWIEKGAVLGEGGTLQSADSS